MSNELKKIVKKIQFKTDKTIEEIAKDIGYARAYFTNQINIGTNKTLKSLLEKYLSDYEQNVLPEDIAPDRTASIVHEYPVDYSKALPLGEFKITLKDYIEDLKSDKKKLQNTIDANLTAMMQILTVLQRHDQAFHETILKSLSRLEGDNIDLVLEARRFEAELQVQDSLRGSNAQVDR